MSAKLFKLIIGQRWRCFDRFLNGELRKAHRLTARPMRIRECAAEEVYDTQGRVASHVVHFRGGRRAVGTLLKSSQPLITWDEGHAEGFGERREDYIPRNRPGMDQMDDAGGCIQGIDDCSRRDVQRNPRDVLKRIVIRSSTRQQ